MKREFEDESEVDIWSGFEVRIASEDSKAIAKSKPKSRAILRWGGSKLGGLFK